MPQNKARTDEEYNALQAKVLSKINKANSAELSLRSKKSIFEHLKKMDVNNIREIEDFYLIVLEFITSNKYCLAQIEAQKKGRKLETELMHQGPDKLIPFLIDQCKTHLSQHYFSKIILIENKYKPGLQEWAQLHSYLLTVTKGLYEEPKSLRIAQVIDEKISTLRKNASFFEKDKINKFIEQIERITQAYLIDKNQDKFTKKLIQQVSNTREIFKNQPQWQKILDDLANAIIQLFNKNPLQSNFSFFVNPATKESLEEFAMLLKPKC